MSSEKDEEKEELTEETEDSSDEENSQSLEELLSLPDGHLAELSGVNEGVDLFITKVKEYVETKESEIEDYQDTVKEFEETIEEREDSLSELLKGLIQDTPRACIYIIGLDLKPCLMIML